MHAVLRSPRWVLAALVTAMVVALFVGLGFWQLRRHEERALANTIRSSRLAEAPIPLSEALPAAGVDVESLEYRWVRAEGTFVPEEEVLVRGRVHQGRAGFHVVTPLRLETGGVVLVDRGWVPLELDEPPVEQAAPPPEQVGVVGIARTSQERPRFGPTEPPGRLEVASRIDLDRLDEQVEGDLAPIWIQLVDGDATSLPVRPEPPAFDDPGPHLGYAVQWFAFALIGAVGFVLLAIRQGRRPRPDRP